ncbi:MAG: PEGA domain-containing protein [Kofleriaceae bacterium]|nr:PEGA domain-containing protein [Kofleriaceae bacterium]
MRFLGVILALAVLAAPARAGTVGVVVSGDVDLQPELAKQLEAWLRGHGHTIGPSLPTEAVNTLLNCMLIDDQGCARGVVEARAKTDAILYGQIAKSRTEKTSTIVTLNWIQKGKDPVGMRRTCESCTKDLMASMLDEVLGMVVSASAVERGRLAVHSRPEGMTVLLDNENIGATPLEREVPAGHHTIVLMRNGKKVGERSLKIHSEVTAEITIPVTIPDEPVAPPQPSRVLPGLAFGLGSAALVAGGVLYFTSETDDGTQLYYRDTRLLGAGVAAGGLVLTGIGTWLWLRRGPRDSAVPVAAIGPHGASIGVSCAF